jgi:protein deglycase
MLKSQHDSGRWIGAICASPAVVLEPLGLLKGGSATCYPSMASKLKDCTHSNERVVVSHYIITSQGPGTAVDFALRIVERVCGGDASAGVSNEMLISSQEYKYGIQV